MNCQTCTVDLEVQDDDSNSLFSSYQKFMRYNSKLLSADSSVSSLTTDDQQEAIGLHIAAAGSTNQRTKLANSGSSQRSDNTYTRQKNEKQLRLQMLNNLRRRDVGTAARLGELDDENALIEAPGRGKAKKGVKLHEWYVYQALSGSVGFEGDKYTKDHYKCHPISLEFKDPSMNKKYEEYILLNEAFSCLCIQVLIPMLLIMLFGWIEVTIVFVSGVSFFRGPYGLDIAIYILTTILTILTITYCCKYIYFIKRQRWSKDLHKNINTLLTSAPSNRENSRQQNIVTYNNNNNNNGDSSGNGNSNSNDNNNNSSGSNSDNNNNSNNNSNTPTILPKSEPNSVPNTGRKSMWSPRTDETGLSSPQTARNVDESIQGRIPLPGSSTIPSAFEIKPSEVTSNYTKATTVKQRNSISSLISPRNRNSNRTSSPRFTYGISSVLESSTILTSIEEHMESAVNVYVRYVLFIESLLTILIRAAHGRRDGLSALIISTSVGQVIAPRETNLLPHLRNNRQKNTILQPTIVPNHSVSENNGLTPNSNIILQAPRGGENRVRPGTDGPILYNRSVDPVVQNKPNRDRNRNGIIQSSAAQSSVDSVPLTIESTELPTLSPYRTNSRTSVERLSLDRLSADIESQINSKTGDREEQEEYEEEYEDEDGVDTKSIVNLEMNSSFYESKEKPVLSSTVSEQQTILFQTERDAMQTDAIQPNIVEDNMIEMTVGNDSSSNSNNKNGKGNTNNSIFKLPPGITRRSPAVFLILSLITVGLFTTIIGYSYRCTVFCLQDRISAIYILFLYGYPLFLNLSLSLKWKLALVAEIVSKATIVIVICVVFTDPSSRTRITAVGVIIFFFVWIAVILPNLYLNHCRMLQLFIARELAIKVRLQIERAIMEENPLDLLT